MEYLSNYFDNFAKFNFLTAKNNIKNILADETIPLLHDLLSQIVNLERNYYNLVFITYKQSGLLGRKKQNESYFDARIHLTEIKEGKKINSKYEVIINYLLMLLNHRCNMIEFYRNIAGLKAKSNYNLCDSLPKLLNAKNSLNQLNSDSEISPLNPLMGTMNLEMDVLFRFFEAHDKTINLYFLDPLNSMQAGNTSLNTLDELHKASEISSTPLALLNWLKELNKFVLDKYTLYFQPVLCRYTVLSVGYSIPPDSFPLVEKIRQFVGKQSCCNATILFDTTKQNHAYTGHGYVLPRTVVEPLIGIQNYQTIFSTSTTPLTQDELFIIVSLIRDKLEWNVKKVAHLTQNNSTQKSISFFVCKVDVKSYLSLIFGNNKTEKDRQIISFINEISNEIQGIKMIELLRID